MPALPSPLTRATLAVGVATPAVYFGAQAIAAPFYPGYSFFSQVASELGSDRAPLPTIFNVGVFLTGFVTLIAAVGFYQGLKELGIHPIWTWIVTLALISCGVGSINAGYFHLPSPRHNPGILGIGMFALPLILPSATWKLKDARWLRTYLLANIAFIAALAPFMAGVGGLDTHAYQGLFQRLFALTLFIPIALVSWFLLKRAHVPQTH